MTAIRLHPHHRDRTPVRTGKMEGRWGSRPKRSRTGGIERSHGLRGPGKPDRNITSHAPMAVAPRYDRWGENDPRSIARPEEAHVRHEPVVGSNDSIPAESTREIDPVAGLVWYSR